MKVAPIDVAKVAGSTALSGRSTGEAHFPRLAEAVACVEAPLVALDMGGVELVTGSYFSAALLRFWTARTLNVLADRTPLLVNLSDAVAEEVEFVLAHSGLAVWAGTLAEEVLAVSPPPLGELDDVSKSILTVLEDRASVSAQDLADLMGKRVVSAYANRLSAMHQQHLVRRRQHGRGYRYMLPWKDENDG